MEDDRRGIDLLRSAIGEVADSVPSTGRARQVHPTPWIWAAAAAVVLAVAGAWTIARRDEAPKPDLGIDVLVLKIHGRDVSARVFEATEAGTIVVAPVTEHPSSRVTAATILAAAGRP